ncbi:hypothetical protein [Streptomyces liliifuscus]|uniref:Uncharacterized protein n=1 Tax=Streptomyces liliifuscus TaxID=2797636 RepID=A0A7T7L167_9ACTN|nr:hypothetical protein [Streptomyces liliifuscus]QQM44582.1 hypothetical protein JEQ17_37705 [Streptomyces liliifuscus]
MSDEDSLRREVFLLAYHLHWSPDAVLDLPAPERRAYLRLLQDQLESEHRAMTTSGG